MVNCSGSNKKRDAEKSYKKYRNSIDKLTKKTAQVDAGKKVSGTKGFDKVL